METEQTKNTSETRNTEQVATHTHPGVQTEQATTTSTSNAKADKTMNVLIAIVAVLVFMAGVQVFQTQQLYAAVSTGAVTGGAQPAQQGGGSTLPSQVGGCG